MTDSISVGALPEKLETLFKDLHERLCEAPLTPAYPHQLMMPREFVSAAIEDFKAKVGAEARTGGGWQPIATWHGSAADRVLVALVKDGQVVRVSEASFNGLGWYDYGGKACHWRTHWMPMAPVSLPSAPTEQP